tara:strand:+ start:96 stop:296 length:201 start_codon:yes stop_codon:yes gene_type:complete
MSCNKLVTPEIGSTWKHKSQDKAITIVKNSYAKNKTRNVVWKYDSTGEIGGCHSLEWFYDDWKPVT